MCGAQTGSHPSAASKGLMQGCVSLIGSQLQHFSCNCARMCSTFPEEVLGILAGLEPLLVPLRSAQSVSCQPCQVVPVCALPHRDSSRLCHCQGPSAHRARQSLWLLELGRCTCGTWELTGLFVVLCCRRCPKTQHSSPSGAALA